MTPISKEIYNEEWNDILGETCVHKNYHNYDEDCLTILRGENDADHKLDGLFEINFPTLYILSSGIKENG